MLKIVSKDFYPTPEDKDFRLRLKPLSYGAFKEVQIATALDVPSGGPDRTSDKQELESNYRFVQKLFEKCIVEIHGVEVDGRKIESPVELLDHLPADLIGKISDEIMDSIRPTDSEVKN